MGPGDLVFAVDGGGTKTAARLLAAGSGEVLAEVRAGPCNLHRDPDGGLAEVGAAWARACGLAGLAPGPAAGRTRLSAGLAGVNAADAPARFRAAFAGFAARHLSSDGYTALVGAFAGAPGGLVSIGTGVVAYRLRAGGPARQHGGWGFPAGDLGGGAWLGLRAVGDWLEGLDGFAAADQPAPLRAAIAARLGEGRPAVLAWLRVAGPADFGGFAPAVVEAASAGDPYAACLLDEAAGHVARLAAALEPTVAEPLVLAGGLAPALASRLAAVLPPDAIAPDRTPSPLHGAWLIALGRARPEFPEGD